MKLLLFIVIAGTAGYLLLKLCLYLYRSFFLFKTFREIDRIYSDLLAAADKDLSSAAENYRKWHSGDKVIKDFNTEEQITENFNTAKEAKAHEEEVHEKFLRLRERFIGDPKKLSESIVTYRRYLGIKLKQRQDAALFANVVTSGAVTFDEMVTASREAIVILKENERKLDILLS